MNFWKSVFGQVRAELTCADPGQALGYLTIRGMDLADVAWVDDLTVRFSLDRRWARALRAVAREKDWQVTLHQRAGLYWLGKRLLRRPVLVVGMGAILAASVYLPSRIFFVRVEGNSAVPTRLILEQAENCGIGFGSSRQAVRSQKVKDALLEAMPQLQWAGVTTSGCVATVTVRERQQEPAPRIKSVSSIVADRDGVITSLTVTDGTARFCVGQAVRAGDVLISGYTDCGFCIRATRAKGEIFARTERIISALTPTQWRAEGENPVSEKKYALIIGKKRINFYKSSGISGTTCDKMYSENYMTLPGGFQLPVCIVTEVWTYADTAQVCIQDGRAGLSEFAAAYLSEQMTAGTVTEGREEFSDRDGVCCLTGQYACVEMIGRQRNEEIVKPNE